MHQAADAREAIAPSGRTAHQSWHDIGCLDAVIGKLNSKSKSDSFPFRKVVESAQPAIWFPQSGQDENLEQVWLTLDQAPAETNADSFKGRNFSLFGKAASTFVEAACGGAAHKCPFPNHV